LFLVFIVLLVCVSGCLRKTKDPVDVKESDHDDDVLVGITRDGKFYLGHNQTAVSDSETQIRVRNGSHVYLKQVVIDGQKFGDIQPDRVTEYRPSKFAHEHPTVSLLVDAKLFRTDRIVDATEAILGHGRFTYALTFQDGHLYVLTENDKR